MVRYPAIFLHRPVIILAYGSYLFPSSVGLSSELWRAMVRKPFAVTVFRKRWSKYCLTKAVYPRASRSLNRYPPQYRLVRAVRLVRKFLSLRQAELLARSLVSFFVRPPMSERSC